MGRGRHCAGTPDAKCPAGTSSRTTADALTMLCAPIVTFRVTVALAAIHEFSPIVTWPGATLPTVQASSLTKCVESTIVANSLIVAFRPTTTS